MSFLARADLDRMGHLDNKGSVGGDGIVGQVRHTLRPSTKARILPDVLACGPTDPCADNKPSADGCHRGETLPMTLTPRLTDAGDAQPRGDRLDRLEGKATAKRFQGLPVPLEVGRNVGPLNQIALDGLPTIPR